MIDIKRLREKPQHQVSPIPPSVNHYTRTRTIVRNGKPLSMVYETKEAKDYKKEFKEIVERSVEEQDWSCDVNDTQHWYVDAVYYFDRIDKDASNYEKCLSDAITETGLIWEDDNVTLFRPQRIYYDKDNPRIELTVYPVEYIGVFDDQDAYAQFLQRCQNCTRGIRNCAIQRKAIEGRIQEEVQQKGQFFYCVKYKEQKDNKNNLTPKEEYNG